MTSIQLCPYQLTRGPNKGKPCGSKNCKKKGHTSSTPIYLCEYQITRGPNKGKPCGAKNCKNKGHASSIQIHLCEYKLSRGPNKGKTCGAKNCKNKRHVILTEPELNPIVSPTRTEVQAHGFSWEKEINQHVYGATLDELKKIKYNSKIDLPAELNRLERCNISIKTSGNLNRIDMADCLRVYDEVGSDTPIHMTLVLYKQNDTTNTKHIIRILEIDLTNTRELLFGTLTRSQIEELDRTVKTVPQKRNPTKEEHTRMYSVRDELQKLSGAIHLNIKCDSKQSRLQCGFNHFQKFIETHPEKIIAQSNTNEFRGGVISPYIVSSRRVRNKKTRLLQ